MQESKYEVINWKKWKMTKELLIKTKNELYRDIKAISYDDSLPGSSNKTVIEKYNKLIENIEKYEDYIKLYDVMINRLEDAIANLLNEKQRTVIIIYANNPNKGDSRKRESEALEKGFSRTYFYELIDESFEILDTVLSIPFKNELVD